MRSLWAMALVGAVGCSGGAPAPSLRVGTREAARLLWPELGAQPADYHALEVRLRLYGVQPEAAAGPFATVAEVGSWQTHNLALGELVGRNLEVTQIDAGGLELDGPGQTIRLPAGGEAAVRIVEHRFDTAVSYEGRGRYRVDAAAVRDLTAAHGLGGALVPHFALYGPALEVTRTEPRGLLSQLGLAVGDRVLAADGRPAAPGALAAVAERLANGRPANLRISRNGEIWWARYRP